jgi:hypothetical protein
MKGGIMDRKKSESATDLLNDTAFRDAQLGITGADLVQDVHNTKADHPAPDVRAPRPREGRHALRRDQRQKKGKGLPHLKDYHARHATPPPETPPSVQPPATVEYTSPAGIGQSPHQFIGSFDKAGKFKFEYSYLQGNQKTPAEILPFQLDLFKRFAHDDLQDAAAGRPIAHATITRAPDGSLKIQQELPQARMDKFNDAPADKVFPKPTAETIKNNAAEIEQHVRDHPKGVKDYLDQHPDSAQAMHDFANKYPTDSLSLSLRENGVLPNTSQATAAKRPPLGPRPGQQ